MGVGESNPIVLRSIGLDCFSYQSNHVRLAL
jgi:hypothetical protein